MRVLDSANRLRTERLGEELAAMGETVVADLPDYRELMVTVGNNSTIRLLTQVCSVPSRPIGHKLVARFYENRIALLERSAHGESACGARPIQKQSKISC